MGNKGGVPKDKPIWTEELAENLALNLREWRKKPQNLWLKDFAIENGYTPQQMCKIAAKWPVLKEEYDIAKYQQESKLVRGGLFNKFNPMITRLILGHVHGYSEKMDLNHAGKTETKIIHYGKGEAKKWEDKK